MENYMKLEAFSLLNFHYIFIDCDRYLADQLFISHKVRVWFGREFARKDMPYRIIMCRVRKRNNEAFIEALSEMSKKMLLLGYGDYEDKCRSIISELNSADRKNRTADNSQIQLTGGI